MRRWRKGYRPAYAKNHCAIDALAQAAGMTRRQALAMAKVARRTPSPDFVGDALLMPDGGAHISEVGDVRAWCSLAGLSASHPVYYPNYGRSSPRPTLAQFCKIHKVGTYLVLVNNYGHVVVVINGKPYGFYQPRSRVCRAFVVTLLEVPDERQDGTAVHRREARAHVFVYSPMASAFRRSGFSWSAACARRARRRVSPAASGPRCARRSGGTCVLGPLTWEGGGCRL